MADEETPKTESPETPQAETQEAPAATSVPETPAAPTAEETKAEETKAEQKAPEATPAADAPKADAPKDAASATDAPKDDAPAEAPARKRTAIEILLDPDGGEQVKIVKAKGSKNITVGIAHVWSTFNNTKVSITDINGNLIGWSSGGKVGFKGSRKSTAYAAQMVAQDAGRQAMAHGLKEVEVRVKGPGSGRESAVRALQALGLVINLIKDVTPVPHNGCRPPKQRRV